MSLLSRLFGRRAVSTPPSCLVLGVVKSLKEDLTSWDTSDWHSWRHRPTGLAISSTSFDSLHGWPRGIWVYQVLRLTRAEEALLIEAVNEAAATLRAQGKAKADELMAPKVAFFTKLGCPDGGSAS